MRFAGRSIAVVIRGWAAGIEKAGLCQQGMPSLPRGVAPSLIRQPCVSPPSSLPLFRLYFVAFFTGELAESAAASG